ncbi:DUF5347 family protein [Morganella morganii]|uniref:DUF5347 family protein n=1 Tax=Morganella morganii TaxID=582 RepID=UPI001BDB236A|nr:DUF5347 family protein [Morganella morganii]MBT0360452.1 DUF5347 family protein [Morganella morganii subsp. morganii]
MRATAELIDITSQLQSEDINRSLAGVKSYKNNGMSFSERTEKLTEAGALRTTVFFKNKQDNPDNRELAGFLEYMRLSDKRMLDMIFFLAELGNKERKYADLTKEEKQQLIIAINKIKSLTALMPKNISYPI